MCSYEKHTPQWLRVLKELHVSGDIGITPGDFKAWGIGNPSAVIHKLRKSGLCVIESVPAHMIDDLPHWPGYALIPFRYVLVSTVAPRELEYV